jgi:hypothetical protein
MASDWMTARQAHPKELQKRASASAERQTVEIQSVQSTTGVRTTATRLSDEQLHEAEAMFRRMDGKPRPRSVHVDFALSS